MGVLESIRHRRREDRLGHRRRPPRGRRPAAWRL